MHNAIVQKCTPEFILAYSNSHNISTSQDCLLMGWRCLHIGSAWPVQFLVVVSNPFRDNQYFI